METKQREIKQRELKFRAWYDKSQTWVYFDLNKGFATDLGLDIYRYLIIQGARFFQFTGLSDKNGKEIYEGDIVKCHDHPTGIEDTIGEVVFSHGRYWVGVVGTGSIMSLDDYGTAWTEVLGNVYSTPDLIK